MHVWEPAQDGSIRVDDAIVSGSEITPHYDPMIAKVIAYADTRSDAVTRLSSALQNSVLCGPPNNVAFLRALLDHADFRNEVLSTTWLESTWSDGFAEAAPTHAELARVVLAHFCADRTAAYSKSLLPNSHLLNWTPNIALGYRYGYEIDGADATYECSIVPQSASTYAITCGEEAFTLELIEEQPTQLRVRCGEVTDDVYYRVVGEDVYVDTGSGWRRYANLHSRITSQDEQIGDDVVVAPMHGALVEVKVAVGDAVEKGETVAVLEAMKMQHQLNASRAGTVTEVNAAVGDQLTTDRVIVRLE